MQPILTRTGGTIHRENGVHHIRYRLVKGIIARSIPISMHSLAGSERPRSSPHRLEARPRSGPAPKPSTVYTATCRGQLRLSTAHRVALYRRGDAVLRVPGSRWSRLSLVRVCTRGR
jgi:hypothetical protein